MLIATAGELGGGRRSLSQKFGLSESALHRHRTHHIPESYKQAVRVGPFESEEKLRRLVAESGASVLERYNAIYGGHLQRWLNAYEAGQDKSMVDHGRLLSDMLGKIALLTRELMPPGSHIENHLHLSADFHTFQQRAVRVLKRHPEALNDWLNEFAPAPQTALIEATASSVASVPSGATDPVSVASGDD